MVSCRLIIDPPQDGAWNMAMDEALLNEASGRGVASLRFYQWREPTLSLGYFQSYRERESHEASRLAAVVRRLSGGAALLHDRELTYSLCLPAVHSLARDSAEMYRIVHRALINVLAAWKVTPSLYGDRGAPLDGDDEPFLCFARRTGVDVVLPSGSCAAPAKILGSAQRRRRGAVLQHGGVLLSASPLAPELTGIEELTGTSLSPDDLIGPWQTAIAAALGLQWQPYQIAGRLRETAQQLQSEKYAHRSWTDRR